MGESRKPHGPLPASGLSFEVGRFYRGSLSFVIRPIAVMSITSSGPRGCDSATRHLGPNQNWESHSPIARRYRIVFGCLGRFARIVSMSLPPSTEQPRPNAPECDLRRSVLPVPSAPWSRSPAQFPLPWLAPSRSPQRVSLLLLVPTSTALTQIKCAKEILRYRLDRASTIFAHRNSCERGESGFLRRH